MVKIQPDWRGGSYTRNLYVAVRVAKAGDANLASQYSGKVRQWRP